MLASIETDDFKGHCCCCSSQIIGRSAVICECAAVLYCSEACKRTDFVGDLNCDHAHNRWCSLMKHFMLTSDEVKRFPFTFGVDTADSQFSESKLFGKLTSYGVYTMGLWKYLFPSVCAAPGEELNKWTYFIPDRCVTAGGDETLYPHLHELSEEIAMLEAYTSPSDVVLMSVPPPCHPSAVGDNSLVTLSLADWSAYYSWRSLPLTSLIAFLVHWPLTLYFMLSSLLPIVAPNCMARIRSRRSLTVHLLGAEREVDFMPVFKELEFLISHSIDEIRLVFIGPGLSPKAHNKIYRLSERLSARLWCGLYHEFISSVCVPQPFDDFGDEPDFVVGFNAGLAAYPTWPTTLELLAKMMIPVFFTDSCQYSCVCGFQVLRKLHLLPDSEERTLQYDASNLVLNPFRSPLRITSTGTRWPWFSNAFVFCPFNDLLTARMTTLTV